ncbi:acetylesterase [Bacillus cereus]|uniref:alpha/beta hydrolase n=1 Tax=Bacillus cereus TaxID=1396 RepID=UPI000BF3B673|nr:alpha/beta hydrolase [Bacillus cereus]PER13966.1 acetylesterase [Bacillus cereus]PEV55547.1 acetylesterase [Bacillus cereus]
MKIKIQKPKIAVKKGILISLLVLLIFILSGIGYWFLSPTPRIFLIKKAFEKGLIFQSDNYNNARKETKIIKDINYNSKFPDGTLDIISPKNSTEETPIIFWVHGGGFVGGDKSSLIGYAVELAAHGYTVVNINYTLAPKEIYPTPVLQLGEAYNFIKNNKEKYALNLDHVYFAGDSAGAQIAGQFVNIQTSSEYAQLTKIKATVNPSTIKGVLLFCGPYDVSALAKMKTTKAIQDFMSTIGWAYLGKKEWESLPEAKIASILNYVTKDYPPAFITDGNSKSFEDQGKTLVSALQSKGVHVDSLFFDKDVAGEITHDYQLNMNTPAGHEAFEKTLKFLSENK